MAHVQYVDGLIREYMLFRGFSTSLKAFDAELKLDKDRSFRVDKIIDKITHSINTQDLGALRDMWAHLDGHLFTKLEHSYTVAVKKLESGMLKLYLVTAFSANKMDKITEFFGKLAHELQNQPEWKEWFLFPFCKNPEEHPVFGVCFTKQWQDTLMISLHNFLATIFQCMPQPTLIRAETEASMIKKLQDENASLKSRLQALNQPQASGSSSASTSHQSRISAFTDQKTYDSNRQRASGSSQARVGIPQSALNDVVPFDIPPPAHIIDDFYIIAQETLSLGQSADIQAKGFKSLIRNMNIGTGGSPVLGRKDNRNKKRSGSVGSRTLMQRE
ncbi:WD repeat-containing protein 91 [Phlebotomus argentipes]|uniref:WD repeat-containing protein 91 n=1 Tax=Phlebotomus argentipes TaxID=94469 RepID=UPI002892A217|nr:WD repeat-containing protein 91 [Phlebotomus argentipes]